MKAWTHAQRLLRDESFMERYARRHVSIPVHIAFLYSGSRLLSAASNLTAFGHAEINCIDATKEPLGRRRSLKLLVVRVLGPNAMSRPCVHCSRTLRRRLPAARVFYTASDGTLHEDRRLDNTHLCASRR